VKGKKRGGIAMEIHEELDGMDDGDYELIIRAIPLTKDVLVKKRRNIRKAITLAALSKLKEKQVFTVDDLIKKIKDITRCTINRAIIIRTLNELEKEDIIKHMGQLDYTLEKNIDIPSFQEKTDCVWADFLPYLRKKYPDYNTYLDNGARNLFDEVLLRLLIKFKISSGALNNQIDILPYVSFKKEIENIISNYSLSENLSKKYPNIIITYLQSKSKILLDFIYNFYSCIINTDLVLREQEIPEIDFSSNFKFLLIDTSFLVALMCTTDNLYPLASAIINQCKKYGIPLYYTYKTQQEMQRFINGSKKEMEGLTISKKTVIRSQFVKDFSKQETSWNDYVIYLNSWQRHVESQHNIIPLPKHFEDEIIDEEIYQYVIKTLPILSAIRAEDRAKSDPNYIPRIRDELQIEHDAYCLGLVSRIKKESAKEGIHLGPLFLTFDNLLSGLNTSYFLKDDEFGLLIQPRTLLNYLLIYSKIDFEDKEKEYVTQAIIKYTISEPEANLELEEYIRLITFKVGLDEPDIEIVKEIFLQSPLLDELKKALKLNRGDLVDDVANRIISNENYINTVVEERRTREKLLRVSKKLREKEEELSKERAAREALERTATQNNISVVTNVNANINVTIQKEINNLISLLEAENAFDDGILKKPSDVSTKEKIIEWLSYAKKVIDESNAVKDGVKVLLPLITHLIGKISGA